MTPEIEDTLTGVFGALGITLKKTHELIDEIEELRKTLKELITSPSDAE